MYYNVMCNPARPGPQDHMCDTGGRGPQFPVVLLLS